MKDETIQNKVRGCVVVHRGDIRAAGMGLILTQHSQPIATCLATRPGRGPTFNSNCDDEENFSYLIAKAILHS